MTFVRGQGSADAIKKAAAGVATFGFADAGSLVLARGTDGAGEASRWSIAAAGDLRHQGQRYHPPKDLEGKTVADTASSSVRLLSRPRPPASTPAR